MPEGRPYSLGNSSADYASINATSEMSASSRSRGRAVENPRAVSYENDAGYAAPSQALSAGRSAGAKRSPQRARAVLALQEGDQGGVDLVGPLLLDPVTGAVENELLPQVRAARAPSR